MQRSLRTGGAGLLLWLVLAAPAAAATVTVRVEGATQTLVPQTQVTTSADVVVDKTASNGTTCPGTSGGGALELATKGDWSGRSFSPAPGDQVVERILTEDHPFEQDQRYWSVYVDNAPLDVGLCAYEPQEGDELLFAAFCFKATTGCFTGDPLDVRGAATAAPGVPYTVAVDEYTSPFQQTPTKAPSAGATVTGGDAPATTGADGTAAVTLSRRGPVTLTATKGGRVRDELTVCVTDGRDGFCGTDVPPPPCFHLGDDGRCGTVDRLRPEARIVGIEHRQRFRRGAAPRELQATVSPDHSGVASVAFSLLRKVDGKCTAFDGRTERFRRARCGTHPSFAAGDGAEVSYLLPRRLGKGRYVLHVTATDRAGNADIVEPGRSRVVFHVR